jgi:hypothetical protein
MGVDAQSREQRSAYAAPAILDLAVEGLQRQGGLRLRIDGESMMPLLKDGDLVVVRPLASGALKPGALILVRIRDTLITHRLIGSSPAGLIAKGDNRGEPDDLLEVAAVLGIIVSASIHSVEIDFSLSPWPVLNRWLATLGKWELRLAGTGFNQAGARRRPRALRRRLAALPPRALSRLLVALGLAYERSRRRGRR